MKLLKLSGWVLAGLVVLIILVVAGVFFLSSSRINKTYDVQVESLQIPTNEEAIERGQHIATIRGCVDCHNGNLGGKWFIQDPAMGNLYATNLTPGQGGIGRSYTDADWVRAIRHGLGPDGKPLLFMPSQEYYYLGDEDLGALVAYLKALPAVDKPSPTANVGPLARVLFLTGEFPLLPAEMIDHSTPPPPAPEQGVTVAYGQYLAVGCIGCHGQDFSGGPIAGAPPDWPPASNLTPAGRMATWSEADFIEAMRTGLTPDGYTLNAEYMAWPTFGQMTDDELKALWLYLESLPPTGTGSR